MFKQPLKIRDFHSGDPEILHEIDHICFPEDIAFSRGELLFYLNHAGSITRVAESSVRIVGFVLGRIENRRHARILTLDVVPEAHRQGIGLALMEDIHRILKSRRILASVLEVGKGNLAARSLYERMRYRYVETLPGYYNGNEDAYRMALVFDYGLGT